MKAQLLKIDANETRLTWYCPGCKCHHGVPIPPNQRAWQWNGSTERPTLSPSILIDFGGAPDRPATCHCFVTDGRIQFCADSGTTSLARRSK